MFSHDEHEKLVADQLKNLGLDISSNGLYETPARVARYHLEHLRADGDPVKEAAKMLKPFDSPGGDVMVNVKCSFHSTCEHHLSPFYGTAQVIYLPKKKVTGLSKIERALEVIGQRPTIQERITRQMVEAMMTLKPMGVLVDLTAQHMCMICRGIKDPQSVTRTRAAGGFFRIGSVYRAEAVSMLM
jgi:GTP cyclohydrolase IA